MGGTGSFTGRKRRRATSRGVRVADVAARLLISVGGIGTIVAVLLVCFFLVSVAVPLFFNPAVEQSARFAPPWQAQQRLGEQRQEKRPLRIGLDEYQSVGWALLPDYTIQVFRADTGATIQTKKLFEDTEATAVSFSVIDNGVAVGFADGTVRLGSIGFSTKFFDADRLAPNLRELPLQGFAIHEGGLLQRTDDERFRLQTLAVQFDEPIRAVVAEPILLIDYVASENSATYCTLSGDGKLRFNTALKRKNLLTQKVTFKVEAVDLPATGREERPAFVKLLGRGDMIVAAWPDGEAVRYDTRNTEQPQLAERLDLVPGDAKLTALELLLGRTTLLVGDSRGAISAWFTRRIANANATDGAELYRVREIDSAGSAVTVLATSSRERVIAAGYADGLVRMFYATSGKRLVETRLDDSQAGSNQAIVKLAIAPKADGILAASAQGLARWDTHLRHPEASLGALFGPVWYEGYDKPEHVWQSSSGTQDTEVKLGLMPLIFGTLKATFYSMLFGTPLALLAAIYSNAFLTGAMRSRIKPTIELMASLPSVVLGFLAAMVIAPIVERQVPAVLATFVCVPLAFMLGARFWQLLPRTRAVKLAAWRFPIIVLIALPLGLVLAFCAGPMIERTLFAGNMPLWLDGQIGTGLGAWMLLFVPLAGGGLMFVGGNANKWLRNVTGEWTHTQAAAAEAAKFLLGCFATVGIALGLSWLLSSVGFDPRGTFVGTYDQRNALVVGFIMGFAIIPIIYTIADDALSSVPETLRSASLGCGATPWQTTIGVVVPTAMSGLFSAVMIGLGRAVGETMIVLMAAGNTPVMSWNLFNGFRTLSANIAVELPEAVKDGTHYRTLFLAALVLFAMTFAVNTVAETIRMRFRKRAYQL